MKRGRIRLFDITTIEELRAAMTDTQPSRRYPDRASNVKAAYTSYRTVDSIRKVALECAVPLITTSPMRPDESDTARATRVLHVAVMLEQYLTGEEANDPSYRPQTG